MNFRSPTNKKKLCGYNFAGTLKTFLRSVFYCTLTQYRLPTRHVGMRRLKAIDWEIEPMQSCRDVWSYPIDLGFITCTLWEGIDRWCPSKRNLFCSLFKSFKRFELLNCPRNCPLIMTNSLQSDRMALELELSDTLNEPMSGALTFSRCLFLVCLK